MSFGVLSLGAEVTCLVVSEPQRSGLVFGC